MLHTFKNARRDSSCLGLEEDDAMRRHDGMSVDAEADDVGRSSKVRYEIIEGLDDGGEP